MYETSPQFQVDHNLSHTGSVSNFDLNSYDSTNMSPKSLRRPTTHDDPYVTSGVSGVSPSHSLSHSVNTGHNDTSGVIRSSSPAFMS